MQSMEYNEGDVDLNAGQQREITHTPTMIRWLANFGVIDSTVANYILIGTAAIFIGVSLFIYAGLVSEPAKNPVLEKQAMLRMAGLQ